MPRITAPSSLAALSTALLAGTALALIAVTPAAAAEVEPASTIDSVTVFPDGAVVTRKVTLDLAEGAHALVFRNLPLSVDPASLRVEGKASAGLVLGAVDLRLTPADPGKIASEGEAQLKAAREERDRLAGAVDALDGRKAMILRFGQSGPERGEKAEGLAVAQWSSAWTAVGEALALVNEDLRKARGVLAEAEARVKSLELAETARRSKVAPERAFVVAVEASTPLKGELSLHYRVQGANWRPVYDAALTTGEAGAKGKLSLTRRALITQRTGEDWTDVALQLSTTRVSGGTALPQVQSQIVNLIDPAMPVPMSMARGRAMAEAADGAAKVLAAPTAPAPPAVVARQQEAVLDAGDFHASYRLAGRVSVPKDGSAKSVVMQSHQIEPDLMVRAAPMLDPTAYLEAAFVHQEEAPLLAGEVSLIRDGAYVGKGRLNLAAAGEKVLLGFGADDRVKVTRVPVKRKETEPMLIGTTRSDTRDYKITVRNLHDFAIRAQIIDQMPVSEHGSLTVEPLSGMTQPTEKTIEDRRGVVGWTYDLKPKEEKDIRFGYRMRWPVDREVTYSRSPR
jgi:uncharacterized protein (TIGR02231 family)